MRLGLLTSCLAALAFAASGALGAPNSLNLPLTVSTKITVPTPATAFADKITLLELSPRLHLFSAEEGFKSDFFRLTPAFGTQNSYAAIVRGSQLPEFSLEHSSSAALQWDVSNWAGLQLTTASGTGSPYMLDEYVPPALPFADHVQHSAAALSTHVSLGNGWITSFSYNVDISRLDLRAGATADLGASTAHGQSYSVTIAKRGLFGNADSLGLSVSRPSEDYFGGISLTDAGLENRIDLMRNYRSIALSDSKETDVGLGYVTSFFHGALALQANAGYQMNANGQNGANGVTVLSRAKINF